MAATRAGGAGSGEPAAASVRNPLQRGVSIRAVDTVTDSPQVSLEFKDVVYGVGKVTILHKISGRFDPGTMTAVMGPSGAGKTTLLNLLTGITPHPTAGEILLNGRPRSLPVMRKNSTFITQDDLLMPALTPDEAMSFAAELRRPNENPVKRQEAVDKILKEMGLWQSSNVVTGHPEGQKGLSGGQRKRLSIALELISTPSLIFLDEPTSGLDSRTSLDCVARLKALARRGHTIVCTIHQPSSTLFAMFDNLLMMANGTIVYEGPAAELVPAMKSAGITCPPFENPSEIVADVVQAGDQVAISKLTRVSLERAEARAKRSPRAALGVLSYPKQRYPQGGCGMFRILLRRALLTTVRDRLMTRVRMGAHVGMGVLLGFLYYQLSNHLDSLEDRVGLLFFSLVFLQLLAIMPTVLTFPVERAVFEKEHRNNWYNIRSYFAARGAADIPLSVVIPTVFTFIVYWMTNIGDEWWRFAMVWHAFVAVVLLGQALGVLIGSAAPNVTVAVFLAPMAAIPPLLFCGFFVNLSNLGTFFEYVSYASYMRWAFQAVTIAGFYKLPITCSADELVPPASFKLPPGAGRVCPIDGGTDFLKNKLSMPATMDDYWLACIAVWGFFIGCRFIAFQILRRRHATARD